MALENSFTITITQQQKLSPLPLGVTTLIKNLNRQKIKTLVQLSITTLPILTNINILNSLLLLLHPNSSIIVQITKIIITILLLLREATTNIKTISTMTSN